MKRQAFIQALLDGKQLECHGRTGEYKPFDIDGWLDLVDLRVKPEPREVWVAFDTLGGIISADISKQQVEKYGHKGVLFREVLE